MTKEIEVAKKIIETLIKHNHDAFMVGGCVRDFILNKSPKDIDVATSATPDQVEAIFRKTVSVGKQFGVIVVLMDGVETEVATMRSDSKTSNGRKPDSVEFSSIKEDAMRRDFTINSLFLNPLTEEIIDFNGGVKDLDDKIIRFIDDPNKRIEEDHLRMLRAVRFSSQLGFTIEEKSLEAIKTNANKIVAISKERIKAELDKILLSEKPSVGLNLLMTTGLMSHILPEVVALRGCVQPVKHHKEGDSLVHTLMVVDEVRKHSSNLINLWSALLHDIGKPMVTVEAEKVTAHGHDKVGAEIADIILRRLKASNEEREEVVAIVVNHMRIKNFKEMKRSKKRLLVAKTWFNNLLIVSRADSTCSISDEDNLKWSSEVDKFVLSLGDKVELPAPLVSGKDLISLGLKPGPIFKSILDSVSTMQLDGEIETREQALEVVKNGLTI